jgi:iron complex transport system substrate-binding protein
MVIPGDTDHDMIVSESELSSFILAYLDGSAHIKQNDLRDAAHINIHYPRAIIDSIGQNITIYRPVKRIIALGSYRTEAVKILGASERIVGISNDILKYDYYYPELLEKPTVGTWSKPDYEAIVSLSPDIVITSAHSERVLQLREKLVPAGITVIGMDFYRDYLLKSEMAKLGYILDRSDDARAYIDWRESYEMPIAEFVDGLAEDDKPQVLLEWGSSNSPTVIMSQGEGSSAGYVCTAAGGRNICAHLTQYPKVDSEWILKTDPDIIVKCVSTGPILEKWGWQGTDEPERLINDIIETRPGWDELSAVKNGSFYLYSSEIAWGPDSIVGRTYFVNWFHPQFDADPEEVYREYLERFMDVEYPGDLTFAYPPR